MKFIARYYEDKWIGRKRLRGRMVKQITFNAADRNEAEKIANKIDQLLWIKAGVLTSNSLTVLK